LITKNRVDLRQPVFQTKMHTLRARTTYSAVYGMGTNDSEQLGTTGATINQPTFIPSFSSINVIMMSATNKSSFAVTSTGDVIAASLELHKPTAPTSLRDIFPNKTLPRIVKVATGNSFVLLLSENGKLYGFGNGSHSEVPSSWENGPEEIFPNFFNTHYMVDVHCGYYHVIAQNDRKECFAWGNNDYSQLGVGGDTHCRRQPALISELEKYDYHDMTVEGWNGYVLTKEPVNNTLGWGYV
jgi:alpha-tubulin suppressor-like RCC1 family protein